jgi:hypothetical protein
LGAVLDADADTGVKARLQSIGDRLRPAYDLPDVFPADGLVVHPRPSHPNRGRLPVIGIWLMPDNMRSGIFEDLLCAAMAPESQKYVAEVVDKAKADGMAGFRDVERSKSIIKTHIAWQDPNIKDLGVAIGAHFRNLDSACKDYMNWLERLFTKSTDEPQ